MNLKRTALMTLLLLLLQHTGSVFALVSASRLSAGPISVGAKTTAPMAMSEHELSDARLQSHHHQSDAQHSNSQHHQAITQPDSASMHHADGQHCQDCHCCGVLGCYLAVNVSALSLLSTAPSASFPEFHTSYAGTSLSGLYRPPSFL